MPLGNDITIKDDEGLEAFITNLREYHKDNKGYKITIESCKQRTLTQNAAMHKYCELLADALNEAGFDFRTFIKEGIEVPFNKDLVKQYMWKPVQKAITGKESTTKPETHEYIKIYDALNKHIANHGIHVPWPSNQKGIV